MTARGKLLTASELANQLNLSVETILRLTLEKRIPYVDVGNQQYRYELETVLLAMEKQSTAVSEKSKDDQRKNLVTYEDYLKLPNEPGIRHEVIDGLLIREPSPSVTHQRVSARLQRILGDYIQSVDPEGEILDAPLDVVLSEISVVQPDILYIPGSEKHVFEQTHIFIAPWLIVEILSPSTSRKDRLQKMELYRKSGVTHYWIVDPENRFIEAYVLKDQYYARISTQDDGDVFIHPDFSGLKFGLDEIFPS